MTKRILIFIFCFTILYSSDSCKKNISPLDSLPPATQVGANTFGCLVNGKAFIGGGGQSEFAHDPTVSAVVYESRLWYFTYLINASDEHQSNYCPVPTISIEFDSTRLYAPENYTLQSKNNGQGFANYWLIGCTNATTTNDSTSNTLQGRLNLTTLDSVNHIISGTFFFDVLDQNQDTIKITNGRFDMGYTFY